MTKMFLAEKPKKKTVQKWLQITKIFLLQLKTSQFCALCHEDNGCHLSHVSANDNNDLSYRAKGKKDIFTILKILSAIFQSLKLDNSKHFIMKITAAIRATFLQTTTMISAKEPRKKNLQKWPQGNELSRKREEAEKN